jgi:hypothetical protein
MYDAINKMGTSFNFLDWALSLIVLCEGEDIMNLYAHLRLSFHTTTVNEERLSTQT